MTNDLSVSTIIPTYNRGHLIERAVNSVISQMNKGDKIIVVDDGSTDATQQVLQKYHDRIRYIYISNSGAGKARNVGINEAKTPLIAFLDSDDEWLPGKLHVQRTIMQAHPDLLACYSDFMVCTRKGAMIHNYCVNWHHYSRPWEEILGFGRLFSSLGNPSKELGDFRYYIGDQYYWLLGACSILTSSFIIRRQEGGEALYFPEDLKTYEDWECFARCSKKGKFAYMECETAIQYGHGGPRITDIDSLGRSLSRLTMIARVWGNDTEFLKKLENRNAYEQVYNEQLKLMIDSLISLKRLKEAREKLALLENKPMFFRILTLLSDPVALQLIAIKQLLGKIKRKLIGDDD